MSPVSGCSDFKSLIGIDGQFGWQHASAFPTLGEGIALQPALPCASPLWDSVWTAASSIGSFIKKDNITAYGLIDIDLAANST